MIDQTITITVNRTDSTYNTVSHVGVICACSCTTCPPQTRSCISIDYIYCITLRFGFVITGRIWKISICNCSTQAEARVFIALIITATHNHHTFNYIVMSNVGKHRFRPRLSHTAKVRLIATHSKQEFRCIWVKHI